MPHPMHGCCVGGWFGWPAQAACAWNLLWAYYLLFARNKFFAHAPSTRALDGERLVCAPRLLGGIALCVSGTLVAWRDRSRHAEWWHHFRRPPALQLFAGVRLVSASTGFASCEDPPASRTSHRRDTRRYISASSRSVMPHPMHGCCVGGWFGWTDTTASVWNLLWADYLLFARNKFPALALHTRASLRTCFLVSGHSCCCWPGIAARRMVRYS